MAVQTSPFTNFPVFGLLGVIGPILLMFFVVLIGGWIFSRLGVHLVSLETVYPTPELGDDADADTESGELYFSPSSTP